jgi:hypothetical protein
MGKPLDMPSTVSTRFVAALGTFALLLFLFAQWLARRPVTVAIPADFPTEAATSIRPEIQIPAFAR